MSVCACVCVCVCVWDCVWGRVGGWSGVSVCVWDANRSAIKVTWNVDRDKTMGPTMETRNFRVSAAVEGLAVASLGLAVITVISPYWGRFSNQASLNSGGTLPSAGLKKPGPVDSAPIFFPGVFPPPTFVDSDHPTVNRSAVCRRFHAI